MIVLSGLNAYLLLISQRNSGWKGMRKRRGVLRMEDEMRGVFIGRDGPEVFAGEKIDLVEELF
jgi:hypothetical protein